MRGKITVGSTLCETVRRSVSCDLDIKNLNLIFEIIK